MLRLLNSPAADNSSETHLVTFFFPSLLLLLSPVGRRRRSLPAANSPDRLTTVVSSERLSRRWEKSFSTYLLRCSVQCACAALPSSRKLFSSLSFCLPLCLCVSLSFTSSSVLQRCFLNLCKKRRPDPPWRARSSREAKEAATAKERERLDLQHYLSPSAPTHALLLSSVIVQRPWLVMVAAALLLLLQWEEPVSSVAVACSCSYRCCSSVSRRLMVGAFIPSFDATRSINAANEETGNWNVVAPHTPLPTRINLFESAVYLAAFLPVRPFIFIS